VFVSNSNFTPLSTHRKKKTSMKLFSSMGQTMSLRSNMQSRLGLVPKFATGFKR
jgi:hypothetical protein